MKIKVKILVAILVTISSSLVANICFAQDEGPFDESEPPFAPPIRRPQQTRIEKQDRVEKQVLKSKSKKSDDLSNTSGGEREIAAEKQLYELVNADRAKLNRAPLKLSARLSAMAKAHAQDMMKKNFFSHVNKEGLDAQARAAKMNIGAGVYENIAYQQGDIEDSKKVINLENDFMSEPDGPKNHRYNILHPAHTSVGVGVAIKGDKLILVEEFTDSPPTGE